MVKVGHTHHESCLLNEIFEVRCSLENGESDDLHNVRYYSSVMTNCDYVLYHGCCIGIGICIDE